MKNLIEILSILMISFQIINSISINIIDYASQKEIISNGYNIEFQNWTLKLWVRFLGLPNTQNQNILKIQNSSGQICLLKIDTGGQFIINDNNNIQHVIQTISRYGAGFTDQFFLYKTGGQNWYILILSYQNQYLHIKNNESQTNIQVFDFSTQNQSFLDFRTTVFESEIIFANVDISDFGIDDNLINQKLNEQRIFGFYFFPFMSKNRQFVENISNPDQPPLLLEEYYQTPSDLFQIYKTHNIFSSVKIKFPNYWSSYVFYSMKMALSFSLVAKIMMQATTVTHMNNIVLYCREVDVNQTSQVQKFETILNLQTDIVSQINLINPDLSYFAYNSQLVLDYLEDNTIILNNIWNQSYNFDINNRIANISYYQQLKAVYYTGSGAKNNFHFFINGSQYSHLNSTIRFSKLDKHYCGFSINDQNFYYDFMIQEIIFYQDINENIDHLYMDKQQTISLYCQLDDTLPYFQERFLINHNEVLTLQNCQRFSFFQRCDAFINCIRCEKGKCIQCINNYYLVNNSCLECIFPFLVVDGNCIYPNRLFVSELEPFQTSEITATTGSIKTGRFIQAFAYIQFLNPDQQVFYMTQYLVISPSGIFGGDLYQQNLLTFFSLAAIQHDVKIQASLFVYDLNLLQVNNSSMFRCMNNFEHIYGQHVKCLQVCREGFFPINKFCSKNMNGCLVQEYQTQFQCTQCLSNYKSVYTSAYNLSNCLTQDQSSFNYYYDQKNEMFSAEIYLNMSYTYNSIQYPICNIEQNYFLQQSNCIYKNLEQANLCDQIDQQGKCDILNTKKITPGFLVTSNNILYNYFQGNLVDWKTNVCKSSIQFDSLSYQISLVDGYCFWSAHLSQNQQTFHSCKVLVENCQSCDFDNYNVCTLCNIGSIIQFKQYSECGQPLPNCFSHFQYQDFLYCEECETGYTLVPANNISQSLGLCILNPIQDCQNYYLNDQNIVECLPSNYCESGYFFTNFSTTPCLLQQYYVDQCISYIINMQNDYDCLQCDTNYECLTKNGTIRDITNINEICQICMQSSQIIQACYAYNIDGTCKTCFNTHFLENQYLCQQNCLTFDQNNYTLCQDCLNGKVYQNQQCYSFIQFCQIYDQFGCEICSQEATIYVDFDLLKKCKINQANCKIVSLSNNNHCDQCDQNYRVFRNFNNYDLCSNIISNCLIYSKTNRQQCDQCNYNYRIIRQNQSYDICYQIIDFCAEYNIDYPFICIRCDYGYILSEDNFTCVYSKIDQILCNDSLVCSHQTQKILQSNQFDQFQCNNQIQNCDVCINDYCFQCQKNYFLFQNTCIPNCIQISKQCIQCSKINQQICLSCTYGMVLQNHTCQKPCNNLQQEKVCYDNLCKLMDSNCLQCNHFNFYQCLICSQDHQLNKNFFCQKILQKKQQFQYLYDECSYYCQVCLSSQCQYCMNTYQQQFQNCDYQGTKQIKQEFQQNQNCLDVTLCFQNTQKLNQNCQICQRTCSIQVKQIYNIYQLYSSGNIQFKKNIRLNQQFYLEVTQNRVNTLHLQIINYDKKKYQIQFNDYQLFQLSFNCTPQKIYQFNINNKLAPLDTLIKNKNIITESGIGLFFGSFQILFPTWLMTQMINYFQKIETLSYLSYNDLNGGKLFNFINSLPETEFQIFSLQQNNQEEYKRQFNLLQYQYSFFNILDFTSIITIFTFLVTSIVMSIKIILQQKFKDFKITLQKLKDFFQDYFNKFFYSFNGIIQMSIIPKIGRFFILQQSITQKQKLFLYIFDTIICYNVLQKISKHFNFYQFAQRLDKKNLTIFHKEKLRLKRYENILNFWIALDQCICLIRAYVLYVFQNNGIFSIVIISFSSIFFYIYYIRIIFKFKGSVRIIIYNYIIQEFVFCFYLLEIYFSYLFKENPNIETLLDITFVLVNVLKLLENLIIQYIIKKLSNNPLSHFNILGDESYIVKRIMKIYQNRLDELKIKYRGSLNFEILEREVKDSQINWNISAKTTSHHSSKHQKSNNQNQPSCISQENIKALGLQTAKSSPQVFESPNICKGLFDISGACADENESYWGIQGFLRLQKFYLDFFKDIDTSILKQDVATFIEQYSQDYEKSDIDQLQKECSGAMQRIVYGTICYLTSGSASENTDISSSIIIYADITSTADQRQKCLSYQQESCRLLRKGNLLDDTSSETTQYLLGICAGTDNIPNCEGNDCSARNNAMNKAYDELGISYATEQQYESFINITQQAMDLARQIFVEITKKQGLKSIQGRRLQEIQQKTKVFKVYMKTGGVNIIEYGENSGQDIKENLFIKNIFYITLIFSLI